MLEHYITVLIFLSRPVHPYLLVVTDSDSPGLVLFDGGTPFYGRPPRHYALNTEKNANFISKLLRVDHFTGSVILEQPLECDGFKYPDVFTFYVDSISNDTIEYMSVPLRIVIKGCENNKINGELDSRIELAKKLSSKTLVSVVLSTANLKSSIGLLNDELDKKCWRKSEFVISLGSSVIPQSIMNECKVRYVDVSDTRFNVESKNGDLVVTENFCSTLDPMFVIVMISYNCDVNSEIISSSEHFIKMILWHKRSLTETGRVRRDVEMSDSGLQFERSLYVASVGEELPSGTIVCSVHARSMPPNNNPIEYQMSPIIDTRSHAMFTIDSNSGLVTTLVSLDREFMDVHYLRVIAIDTSPHSSTSTTTLQINVVDANDHSPVFESASGMYEASVRESISIGTTITTIRATDFDIGLNSQVEYSIESISGGGLNSSADETFGIDLRSGIVSVRRNLDREICEVFTVMIKANDLATPPSPRKSAIATLVVKVLDDNDNYPQFSERAYTANIFEDLSPNQRPVIATIKATDADQGLNAVVRYAIIGGNTQGHFSIDSQNGEVSLVKSLDYESMRSYRLMIRAQDGGNPSRSNTTQLLVNIKDVNDNPPRFYTSLFQESVLENVAVGYSIVRIQAYDADEGENAALTYYISSRDFEGFSNEKIPIVVDEKSGWVYTTHLLDREINSKYQFQVVAEDGGDPPKTATASVVVTIQDVNDNEPIFNPKQYDVVISEDSPPGTPLTTITATDPDENPRIHYEIVSGNSRGRFAIATHSGKAIVTVSQPLDYKQEKRFILSVTATDSGGLFDTATIYVNVTDANNFAPIFDNAPYIASVYEDAPVGTTVLIVSATDGDVGQNAMITYSLASGYGDASEFTINAQSGAIVTTKILDRELQSGYLLTVSARDGGNPSLSDTTDVEISITDINDNAPQFFNASYYGSVSEDALTGTSVLQVSASDADSGLNGRIKYALGDGVEAFVIDSTSGILRTAVTLDRESIPQYNIHVFAIDKGSPSLSTAVPVTIRIEDVNDSPPVFESDKLVMYIAENSPIGSTVGELYAKDPDEGSNAAIQYSIIGGEDSSSFSLLRRPGIDKAELLTSVELDYESNKKKFELVVRASSPPLHSDAPLTVYLTDVNDNAPRLSDFQVIFNNFKNYFPIGPFSQVPAFDADVSDKLIYRIVSGNNANLVQLNESNGMLTLSPQLNTNVPKIASMEISVSDGVNEIKSTMTLIVRLVTDEMLFNSVTVRLADMTEEAFLSPLLEYFISGLAAIIPCPKENIYIFSIQNDIDVDNRVLNVSFSAKQPDGIFYSPQYLQERVYLNRGILTRLSTVQILPFEDNLCVQEPCLNFEICLTVLKFGNASTFINSDTVLFRPIYPVTTFACQCPYGFTGSQKYYLCDTEVDLCYSNPCKNGGKCHSKESGYTCICPSRFTGENCEISLSNDNCKPGICHSGATCTPLKNGGFSCDNNCSPMGTEYYDEVCKLRSRSFSKSSFLTFPSLKQRYRLHLSLKFSSLEESGLLLYNGRYNERHDFIALELIEGGRGVQFSFSLGYEITYVIAYPTNGIANDGLWHTVTVSYINRTATISLDDCDVPLTVKYGTKLGYTCANLSTQRLEKRCEILTESCHRFLDLTGPLQIGGLPLLPDSTSFQVQNKDFIGCIADVYIDYKLLDLNSYVADNGTIIGCPERKLFCMDNPCKNSGHCTDHWGTFKCTCPESWGGKDCSQPLRSIWRFSGDGIVAFNPLLRTIQFPWYTSLSLKTKISNSPVMTVNIGQNTTARVFLESGYIVYIVDGQKAVFSNVKVNDGKWHNLEIIWQNTGGVKFMLDYGVRSLVKTLNAKLQGQFVGKIQLGNFNEELTDIDKSSGFNGCIKDVRIGHSGGTTVLEIPEMMIRVREDCEQENPCEYNKCPVHSDCIPSWHNYTCKCHSGFVGKTCENICDTNPCENNAICEEKPKSVRGYTCHCKSSSFTGEYCENELQESCPISWWGHHRGVCGPCNCRVDNGYNPHCNKTTGQCYCKDNHFTPYDSDKCLECGCYNIGSFDRSCDSTSGQCKCRPGVIGRKCDKCPNSYAEVTLNGCEVIYDGCPKSISEKIWWPRAKWGELVIENCPPGSVGKATRLCQNTLNGWQRPYTFNCVSNLFIELQQLTKDLESKSMKVTTFVAVNSAISLHEALNNTHDLHGSDILIGQKLVRQLLSHEGSLSGLNLTHSQDKDYIKNLIMASSRLLDIHESDHWQQLNILTSESPFGLMNTINNYVTTLLTTQHDTYTDPFEIVSPNIVIGLDIVTAESLFGFESEQDNPDLSTFAATKEKINLPDSSILQPAIQVLSIKPGSEILGLKKIGSPVVVLPKYNNYLLESSKFDKHTQVMVPIDLLGIEPIKQGMTTTKGQLSKNNAVVGYVQYRTIGALLPLHYDDTVLKRYSVDLQVSSSVMAFVAALNNSSKGKYRHSIRKRDVSVPSDRSPLESLIRVRIWLNKHPITIRSNPQCVRWSTSRVPSGEWTRAGCHTELPNEDNWWEKDPVFINCTCNQLSTYAVLTDVVDELFIIEYSNFELFTIFISFGLAIIALIVTCILLVAVRAGTNTSSIYTHLAFCLLLTQCVYLAATQTRGSLYTYEIWCKFCAIILHYTWLATIGWSLVSALHLYRMLTELRDVNHGQMGFYHSIGYVLPAIIVSLSVGVRINQYGNFYFCWLSVYESVIWSLIAPTCLAIAITIIVLLLCIRAAFTLKDHVLGYGNLRSVLVVQVICVPILVGVWLLEVVVASEHDTRLTYSLCAAVCSQGWLILVGLCYSNAKLRCGVHHCALRLIGKEVFEKNGPDSGIDAVSPPTIRSSLSYRNTTGILGSDIPRKPLGISMSSTTSRSTNKTSSSPYSPTCFRTDTHLRNISTTTSNYDHSISDLPSSFHRTHHTSDSDSECSGEGRSLDLASSHSSDDDDSSRHQGLRSNVTSTRPTPFLPDINEDPGMPPSLNVITNSQLFPNLKPLYAPRWTNQPYPTVQEEEHSEEQHRWIGSTISDPDNSVINNRMSFEPPLINNGDFNYHKSSTFNSLNKTGSDCDVDDKISLGEKYLFPYTAEEDHCHSPYRDIYGETHRHSDLYNINMPSSIISRGSENGSIHSVDNRFVPTITYSQSVSPTQASTSTLNLHTRHGYTNEYEIQEILESEIDSSETSV
ncbi:protocadherin-like wing polarity protein stan isoform X2 [Daktulosphaira vitifoliae]|uniref:protocadherin-like wing polarity protein stan isoform X2 n=1 Tax=Daktulosphaira vitifoliae TaxID=58002 RepID=UPI0021AA700F|nr:protocadherin-like wing polarity protein stan isoform X2 [Daktulosphaira vitifoliae]